MKDRLKTLRKTLKLTQEEFSKKIGIKRNTLANYEIGRNEPIDGIIFSICREFNVSEEWLRTGSGDMFIEMLEEDELAGYCGDICTGRDPFMANCLLKYMRLADGDKKTIQNFISSLSEYDK